MSKNSVFVPENVEVKCEEMGEEMQINISSLYQYLNESREDDGEQPESDISNRKNRRPKKSRRWKMARSFDTKAEAIEHLNRECTWSQQYTNQTSEGKKCYFRCNKVKRKGVQCEAHVYLLEDNRTSQIILFETEEQHTCTDIETKNKRLTDELKLEIELLFNQRYKPKRIHELLEERGFGQRSKSQVNNYLQQLRIKMGLSQRNDTGLPRPVGRPRVRPESTGPATSLPTKLNPTKIQPSESGKNNVSCQTEEQIQLQLDPNSFVSHLESENVKTEIDL